jgi:hypothetical protein
MNDFNNRKYKAEDRVQCLGLWRELTEWHRHIYDTRAREGQYTPGEIDRTWTAEIEADYQNWIKSQSG